jgi:hypothetical protein
MASIAIVDSEPPAAVEAPRRPVATALRAVWCSSLAGALAGLIAGGFGARISMRIISLTAGREHYGELTDFEFPVGQITIDGTTTLLFTGAYSGIAGGIAWLAVRHWLITLGHWRGLIFGSLILATVGFGTIDDGNFDFTRFGSPALNIALFAAIFIAFGLLVVPLTDWLERVLPPLRPTGPLSVGRAVRSIAFGVGVGLCIVIGASSFVFLLASDPIYAGPMIILLLLARFLPRQSRWPVIALLALLAIGTLGTLLSISNILMDAYG